MKRVVIKPIDDIAESIIESQDEQAALEFTKVIGKLLKENGVSIYGTKVEDDSLRQIRRGYKIDALGFSEHDKNVKDELNYEILYLNRFTIELQNRIDKLKADLKEARETNGVVLPAEPLDVVKILATETMHYTNSVTGAETERRKYGIKDTG